MTEKQTLYYQEIQDTVVQIGNVCSVLSKENEQLRREIAVLESKLELESKKPATPLAIDENHRTALKHQLASYIKRLDAILDNS